MLTFTQGDLRATAERVLEMRPDPVPRFRLLRDVLRLDPGDATYGDAESGIRESKWFALLRDSQRADGTWGRFHTQDTTVRQPFPTTESAIANALDIGLDSHAPLLQKTIAPLLDYVDGRIIWPDRPEKHDNPLAWPIWVRHYSAAALATIDRHHPRLDAFWCLWAQALEAAFQSGSYDRQREIEALNALLECRMKAPVPFHVKVPLLILSATDRELPPRLERLALEFVLHHPDGIYYSYDRALDEPPAISSRRFYTWTRAHRLLSRYRLWKELAEDAVNWIWAQREAGGIWDLGSKVSRRPFTGLPLSESWRRPESRFIDSTVEMLTLLTRVFDNREGGT